MTTVTNAPVAVKYKFGELMPTHTGTEHYTTCCPSLKRARGKREMGYLCHVCWEPLSGDIYIWRNHVYHADCGEPPPVREVRGSDR